MLEVGTKVFVKILFKEDRPDDTRHNLYSNMYFGTILEQLGNNYYLVGANVSDNSTSGVIHEDEMVNMDLYKPKFEVGEVVRIRQIPYQEKEIYLTWYVDAMDSYIGKSFRITRTHFLPDTYRLEGLPWLWHEANLESTYEFIGY